MFTGLIREIATVSQFDGKHLRLKAKHRPNIGDSIAVNGACLSVTKLYNDGFEVELSDETRNVIALENYKDRVHIEPAMRLSDRIEGHIVQGHIDSLGTIIAIKPGINSTDFLIKIPKEYIKFVIPKGSIAIDGVSLTVNEVYEDSFRLTIIPITLKETLFGSYRVGRRVNIETDMFARYLFYLFKKEKKIDWETVEKIQALF
ncbi:MULTISPECIES: riboflavin synthase [unclassified Nitratiruptor]|uniref:riboflavin synthase n=1 Tax=unclassified Nitratiruptor TaxID=2624044 RepID=UPI0019164023|nr:MULTISPECIES: riboflavin synthase [unclassified Nitratiruptor]BCD60892.1 riboflavin synthase [Nitratiruptor sp. YY08-10]BCD64824.1 riboflavin synthase [Nitratiruptor sp. YY08-14]